MRRLLRQESYQYGEYFAYINSLDFNINPVQ